MRWGGGAGERVVTLGTAEGFSITLVLTSNFCLLLGRTTERQWLIFEREVFIESANLFEGFDRCGLALLPFLPFKTFAKSSSSRVGLFPNSFEIVSCNTFVASWSILTGDSDSLLADPLKVPYTTPKDIVSGGSGCGRDVETKKPSRVKTWYLPALHHLNKPMNVDDWYTPGHLHTISNLSPVPGGHRRCASGGSARKCGRKIDTCKYKNKRPKNW